MDQTLSEQEYIDRGGSVCIFCKSPNINARDYSESGPDITCRVQCEDCAGEWVDIYKLAGITDITKPKVPQYCSNCDNEATQLATWEDMNGVSKFTALCETCATAYEWGINAPAGTNLEPIH